MSRKTEKNLSHHAIVLFAVIQWNFNTVH